MKFEPFELKIGRKTYTITESDSVLFNGFCYQLVTQNYQSGWNRVTPKLSKTKAEKWIKQGYLKFNYKTNLLGASMYYYKFTDNPEESNIV